MTTAHWDILHADPRHQLEYPNEHVVRFLASHPGRGRLLDIGCGAGRHLRLADELGYTPQGIDSSHQAVVQALHRGLAAHRGNMLELPYPDNTFDIALAVGAFYYGTQQAMRDAIAELHRVLKPAGAALVIVRGLHDSRHKGHKQPTHRLTAPDSEAGLTCTFIHERELPNLFQEFQHVTWAVTETLYRQSQWCDADIIITARRTP